MKHFWALPAILRAAIASQHSFSVYDDLLAFPQYEVVFPNEYVTETFASERLRDYGSSNPNSDDSRQSQELSHPSSPQDASEQDDTDKPATYEVMKLGVQRYLCKIPIVVPVIELNETAAQQSAQDEEKELVRANERGVSLLQEMSGNCIYFLSGWWSYSFCYNNEVKQFHQLPPSKGVPQYPPVEDPNVHSFVLGRFPGPEGKNSKNRRRDDEQEPQDETKAVARLETKGESRYMVQRLEGGTTCDLTGRNRKIEVQFHCHPLGNDRIGMIKEISTCSYLMVIYTPRLCHDIAFQPPQENKANPISCSPIYTDEDVTNFEDTLRLVEDKLAAYEAGKEQEEDVEHPDEDAVDPVQNHLPIVGGVAVGAQQLVGGPGREIEKSVVVGGGKESIVGVIAASDGTQMSDKELKKLDIRGGKEIENLKKELSNMADGKAWRLEVVDTPKGREYRGIIEGDEDEDDKSSEKSRKAQKSSGKKAKAGGKSQAKQEEPEDEDEDEGSEEVYKKDL